MNEENVRILMLESGVSENTTLSYITDLKMFEKWLGRDISTAEKMDLVKYVSFLTKEKDAAPASVNRSIYALKKFYDVMEVNDNPAANLRRIKFQRKNPNIFDLSEMEKIFKYLPKRNLERNRLIIVLASVCGLRKGEIVSLNVKDINEKRLTIHGKGNKIRTLVLPEHVYDLMQMYLNGRKDGPLFVSERGGRVSVGAINNIMANIKKETGIDAHMHKFRHTAATYAYEQDNDIRAVQDMLGHSSINTTQIYVHVNEEKISSIMSKSPVNDII